MFLSIIIPAFNEENRLKETLCRISAYLLARYTDSEIIIVDDGSSDRTIAIANDFARGSRLKIIVLKNDKNQGKGSAVKKGILASSGDFVLFSDADLSTPIEELAKFINYIKDGYDVVIGSRANKDSDIRVSQPWYRQMMGKTFNMLIRILLFRDFNDTQCGFKLFRGDIARCIAKDMKIDGFCFDVEMLYLAKRRHCKIKELGIVWNNSSQSKVKILNSSLSMFFDLVKVRMIHEKNTY